MRKFLLLIIPMSFASCQGYVAEADATLALEKTKAELATQMKAKDALRAELLAEQEIADQAKQDLANGMESAQSLLDNAEARISELNDELIVRDSTLQQISERQDSQEAELVALRALRNENEGAGGLLANIVAPGSGGLVQLISALGLGATVYQRRRTLTA